MPRSGYKVLIVLKLDVYGGTESHVCNTDVLATASNNAVDLVKARIQMLPKGADVTRVRLSNLVNPFDTHLLDPSLWANAPHWNPGTTGSSDPDQPKSTVQVRFETNGKASGQHMLFAVPDDIVGENPAGVAPRMVPSWMSRFQVWRTKLLANWGMIARTPQAGGFAALNVTDVSIDALDGRIQVAVAPALPGANIGVPVQLRNFKRSNPAFKSANAKYKVSKIEPDEPNVGKTRYTLAGPLGVDTGTIVFLGTVELVDYRFAGYSDVVIQAQTTRKRGNRSLAGPGRRKTRVAI